MRRIIWSLVMVRNQLTAQVVKFSTKIVNDNISTDKRRKSLRVDPVEGQYYHAFCLRKYLNSIKLEKSRAIIFSRIEDKNLGKFIY